MSRFFLKFLVIKSLGLDPDPIYPDPQTLEKIYILSKQTTEAHMQRAGRLSYLLQSLMVSFFKKKL